MAGYLGAIPVPQATQHRESFTATSGQTTFNTAGYTVGFLDVYLNGSHLSPADFTATNGSDVVLASGASTGDVCDIISYTAFEVANQTFTGTTTLDGAVVINESSADVDFRVESNGNANMLFVDGGNNAVGIGTSSATAGFVLEGVGDARFGDVAGDDAVEIGWSGGGGYAFVQAFDRGATAQRDLLLNSSLRIDSSGNVGIAESDPDNKLDVDFNITGEGSQQGGIKIQNSHGVNGDIAPLYFGVHGGTRRVKAAIGLNRSGSYGIGSLVFAVDSNGDDANVTFANDEKMRLDNSGHLVVGKTAADNTNVGTTIYSTAGFSSVRSGGTVGLLNRLSNDGDILMFRKDDTTVGSIGSNSGYLYIGSPEGNDAFLLFGADIVSPATSAGANRDNAIDLGHSSARFDDIFATNGTIQTSDRNEKQDIASLTSAEMLVAKRISALFKTFRWKDKVAAKGNDARTHTGIIAQDVQAAFTAESLDAGDYSLFISSTWWEHDVEVPAVEAVAEVTETTTDEDGNDVVTVTTEAVEAVDAYTRTDTYDTEDEAPEGATSKTRMGIRYPELLSFVAAYNEQRFAAIETRLTALEG